MLIQLDEQLRARIRGVVFGIATISGVQVRERDERLWRQVEALGHAHRREFTLDTLSEQPRIAAVRAMQKAFGFDPTRYRPSSEALLRRVLKGTGLHQINTAVDVNNLCSLELLLPMCIYDLSHVSDPIRVRIGAAGEVYPGIGRQNFQVEQRVIIADEQGVMGTTVSDSERTKVTLQTTDILLAIYAPAQSQLTMIERHAELAGQRMVEWNGGQVSDVRALQV